MVSTGHPTAGGRTNQKERTRSAIVAAARHLIETGAEITMPTVARAAMVSEATAYRYFPDLVTLLQESFVGLWTGPEDALRPIEDVADPVERVAFASRLLLGEVLRYQGAVRAMISAAITRPEVATRPGRRFGLIDHALAPATGLDAASLARLKLDLAIVVSAEALFTLTDLCGLTGEEAIDSAVRTARTIAAAALHV